MRILYVDHAATTPLDPRVREEMKPYEETRFGNPSSPHLLGREAKSAIERARRQMAISIGASSPQEIVFTSGGTEADNLAILGYALENQEKGNHILVSAVEHHAVLHPCEFLQKQGFNVTYLPVNSYGQVDPDEVRKHLTPETILISVMTANNEVGTIEPVTEIGRIAEERGICFHTDAVQAFGQMPVQVKDFCCSLLSLSSHKIYGPKGAGALYVREGTSLSSIILGGGQERNRRSGTENVAGIVGFGLASQLASQDYFWRSQHLKRLRDAFITRIQEIFPEAILTGHPEHRLPGNAHFLFPGIPSESMIAGLDQEGIAVSAGSACASGSPEPSHVLKAMGIPAELARCAVRFTFGMGNTMEDVETLVSAVEKIKSRLLAPSV